jgi:hypothetical protein
MALKRKKRRYESNLEYSFRCYGHPNVRAKHPKTIEFTKDTEIGLKADCIIGVDADFDLGELKKFRERILIAVQCGGLADEFHAIANPDFDDDREVVIRKSRYRCRRTFGVMLNKGANGLKRGMAELMRRPTSEMIVTVYQKPVKKLPVEQVSQWS